MPEITDIILAPNSLLSNNEKITSAFDFSIECFYHRFSTHSSEIKENPE